MPATQIVSVYDLREFLGMDLLERDKQEDRFLRSLILSASARIETNCNRVFRRQRLTEYHSGEGDPRILMLDQYPVQRIISIHDDPLREFTDASLIDPSYYSVDQKTGIVQMIGDGAFQAGKLNIKVVYEAGYQDFEITPERDSLDFEETVGVERTAVLTPGSYAPDEFAEELQTQLNASGDSTYTVAYDSVAQKFTLSSDGSGGAGLFSVLFKTGSHSSQSIADLLGFDPTDRTGELSYTSDFPAGRYPEDLRLACLVLATDMYLKAPAGKGRFGIEGERTRAGEGGARFVQEDIPREAREILQRYRKY